MKLLLKTMVKGRRSKRRRSPAASLTDDLIVEILARLPARSVCRFKCVSTTWRDLISTNYRKLPQTLAGIFTTLNSPEFWASTSAPHFTNVLGRDCPLVSPWFDFLPANRVDLLDCSNGLVLCNNWPWPTTGVCRLFVCNPTTKKWVELPDSTNKGKPRHLCLGFNPTVSPHFYVFAFFGCYRTEDFSLLVTGVEVYSSETGQWIQKDNGLSYHPRFYSHVFLNGCLHYLTNEPDIAVVDTKGKACRSIPVPDNEDHGFIQRSHGFIQQSQGSLYYANFESDYEDQVVRLVVYVLEDYDSQQWILKHTAEALHVLGPKSPNGTRPFEWVAIHPHCNMIFYTVGRDNKTLMSYDMDRRQVQVICSLGRDTLRVYLPYVPLFSELEALHI